MLIKKNDLSDFVVLTLFIQSKRKLGKSMVVDSESGKNVMSEVRTSSGMFLNKRHVLPNS